MVALNLLSSSYLARSSDCLKLMSMEEQGPSRMQRDIVTDARPTSRQIRVKVVQDCCRLLQSSTRPLMVGLIISPRPIAVPIAPQAVPNRFLSTRMVIELPRTVYMLPAMRLSISKKTTITTQSSALISSAVELLGRKQSAATPAAESEVQMSIHFLLTVGLRASILPKQRATIDPATQGIMSRLPVITQSILKRLMMRSLRLVKMHIATQFTTIPNIIIQNSLGIYNRQLALNYSSAGYCYSTPDYDCSRDSCRSCFSFLAMMIAIIIADITARKSRAEATYHGKLMDLVLSKIIGDMVTLSASKRQGRLSPNPVKVSQCQEAQRAITKPCMVYAQLPAIPDIARITYTPQIYPSGLKSKSMAVANSARKLLMAMTNTVTFMGYLSSTIPSGISVNITGRKVEKQSRLIYIELRLQGSSLSGASRACGMSTEYPYPMTMISPMAVIILSDNFILC